MSFRNFQVNPKDWRRLGTTAQPTMKFMETKTFLHDPLPKYFMSRNFYRQAFQLYQVTIHIQLWDLKIFCCYYINHMSSTYLKKMCFCCCFFLSHVLATRYSAEFADLSESEKTTLWALLPWHLGCQPSTLVPTPPQPLLLFYYKWAI